MAEAFRYITNGGGLYSVPLPNEGVEMASHKNLPIGQDFGQKGPRVEVRHPVYPSNPLANDASENKALLKPGQQSLSTYKVPVYDEQVYKHTGIHPDSLSLGITQGRDEVLNETTTLTHHSGARARYKMDVATGMYAYRGLVEDSNGNDSSWVNPPYPHNGNLKYTTSQDRSDYWVAPTPTTSIQDSKRPRKPTPYTIDHVKFFRPHPDNFSKAALDDISSFEKPHPYRAGTGRYDHTLSITGKNGYSD